MNPMKFDTCTGILAGSGGLSDGHNVITTPVGFTQVASLSSTPVSTVPKPRTFLLFGFGLLGPGLAQRRKLRPAKRSFGKTSAKAPLMGANNDNFSGRSGALIAATLSVLLALGGCGGGGGGGGSSGTGGGSAAGFSYPPSLAAAKSTDSVSGFVAPYALDPVAFDLHTVQQSVLAVASAGKLTFKLSPITLPSPAGTEPGFDVIFDPTDPTSLLLTNSPLDSPGCTGCLKTGTAPATVGGASAGTVTFTYLDPANAAFPLNYSTLGIWSKPPTVQSPWKEVGGPFSAGVLTRGIDLPITGLAHYDGYFIGLYATSDTTVGNPAVGTYLVGASAHADVDLSGPGVTVFSISNITISKITGGVLAGGVLELPVPESGLDLSITTPPIPITRTSTSNLFGPRPLRNSGFGMTGELKGALYGPPAGTAAPPELGGSLAVQNSSTNPTQSMLGSFVLKKQ